MLHACGTVLGLGTVVAAVALRRPKLALAWLPVGYGFAWTGHFFVEKNKPASFKYPLWSLKADFVMWSKIARGTMDEEVARIINAEEKRAETPAADHKTDGSAHAPS
jgi:hypothetical protein